ncbi:MAG: hypothetical protein HYR51_12730 [Candidatus Rokubacteria bacterium]|nr:hypothetical protein [Candidatus Rokubacteria bacterium]
MDFNEYALAVLVRTTLEDARAQAARRALVPRRRSRVRARLGVVLIAVGRRLVAGARDAAPVTRPEASRA